MPSASCAHMTRDRRGQKPAGDDLPLIVQNAEMASSVSKINPDCQFPRWRSHELDLQQPHEHNGDDQDERFSEYYFHRAARWPR